MSFINITIPANFLSFLPQPLSLVFKSDPTTEALLSHLNHKIETVIMKLSEIKAAVAAASAKSTEAFSELSAKIAALQTQVEELIAGASDPDVTDEAFLADLTNLQGNINQLAEIVPNEPAPEV